MTERIKKALMTALNLIKLVAINLLVFILLVAILELTLGVHFSEGSAFQYGFQCSTEETLYDYCPNILHINYMHIKDRFLPVLNPIGPDRRPIYKPPRKFSYNSPNTTIIIGDSFIQAHQMPIQDRMGHYLREKGIRTEEIGSSSWNPYQYSQILKNKEIKEGDSIFIFLMLNDFLPSYSQSVINTNSTKKYPYAKEAPREKSLFRNIMEKSFFYNRITISYDALSAVRAESYSEMVKLTVKAAFHLMYDALTKPPSKNPYKEVQRNHDETNMSDCKSLPEIENWTMDSTESNTFDYIVFSKDEKCWPSAHKKAADEGLRHIHFMMDLAKSKKAEIDFFIIPAGWEFPGENTYGRATTNINDKIILSDGIFNYMKKRNVPIHNLRNFLAPYNSDSENDLYFPIDGHWKPKAHKLIADFLLNLKKERGRALS